MIAPHPPIYLANVQGEFSLDLSIYRYIFIKKMLCLKFKSEPNYLEYTQKSGDVLPNFSLTLFH